MSKECGNCKKRIVRTNDWAGRPSWTHQTEGAAFQDGQHLYCHKTMAEPAVDRQGENTDV